MMGKWMWGVAGVLAGAGLLAFGCDSFAPPPASDCSSAAADTTQPATVSYANQIAPMFEPNRYACADLGCHHSDLPGQTDYHMSTHAELFEIAIQARQRGMCEVKPGDPDSSYVVWKLEAHVGIQGVRMPKDRPAMSAADLQLFRQWILEGARDN